MLVALVQVMDPHVEGWTKFPYELNSVMHYNGDGFAIEPGLKSMTSISGEPFGENAEGLTKVTIIIV